MKGTFFLLSLALAAGAASAAELKEVTGFGNNPTQLKMHLYVPDKAQARPPILVALHWCTGTGPAFFSGTQFAAQADKYGFVVIYPSSSHSDKCWDVHSPEALKHDGGGDPAGIVSMVRYVAKNHNGDSTRVYATGHSSGGMMTNVMLGSYPDLFKAGAAFSGVPFGCFAGASRWSSDCATGKITKTPEAWGDLVRAAYLGYTGPRPRMQLWHGVKDDALFFHNFGEAIKQWTDVLGASQTPVSTESNAPQSGWTRMRYADASGKVVVEAIRGENQPHNLQILADKAVQFLGLDGSASGIAAVGPAGAGAGLTVRATGAGLSLGIRSAPGRVTVDLLRLDGTWLGTIAESDNPTGILVLSWHGSLGDRHLRTPGIYLAAARWDGRPLGAARFAWLAE
jgi:acetylxylan esterase